MIFSDWLIVWFTISVVAIAVLGLVRLFYKTKDDK